MFPITKLNVKLVTIDFNTSEITDLKSDQSLYEPSVKIHVLVRGFATGKKREKKKRKYKIVVVDPVGWHCYLVKFIHKREKGWDHWRKRARMKLVTKKMLKGRRITARDAMISQAVEAAREKIEECLK
jgi:hypothetical protein